VVEFTTLLEEDVQMLQKDRSTYVRTASLCVNVNSPSEIKIDVYKDAQ